MRRMEYGWAWLIIAVMLLIIWVIALIFSSETVLKETQVGSGGVYRFSFLSQETQMRATDEVYYSDEFFGKLNEQYDPELARASLALSMAAFKEKYAEALLSDLGFTGIVGYRYEEQGDEDKVALTFAHKNVSDGQEVVVVAVRGGKYGDEWGSNGRVGLEGGALGYHYGFHEAAEDAIVQLKEYAAENSLELSGSKLWVTGFSRGAAVANVMGELLVRDVTIPPENLFDYTFASPNTVSEDMVIGTITRGIYNIVNPLDIVTRLPMNAGGTSRSASGKEVGYDWDYVKYGTTIEFPVDGSSAQLQVVELLEEALAFATRSEARYVERTQEQVMVPALKETLGKGADVDKRNIGIVLVEALPGVAVFLKNEVDKLDLATQVYVAGLLSGKRNVKLEKEHWPETYWDRLMNGV